MPNVTIPLIQYVFAGLKKKMKQCFGTAPLISTEAQIRDLLMDGSVKSWPITFLKVRHADLNEETIRVNKIGAQSGILGKKSADEKHATRLAVIPIRLDLEYNYLTNSFEDVLSFVAKWLHTGLKNRLNFTLTYLNIDFDIVVMLESQLSIPEKENLYSDNPDYFQYTGIMYLNAYVTNEDSRDMQEVPLIEEILVNNLNV